MNAINDADAIYYQGQPVDKVMLNGEQVWPVVASGPQFGDAIEGGYYIADFVDGGTEYRLILAPKSSEEQCRWDEAGLPGVAGTTSKTDGPGNTATLAASGSRSAALHCAGYSGGGHTDWYLGAEDEWKAIYPNHSSLPVAEQMATSGGSTNPWTSTEASQNNAMRFAMSNGNTYGTLKRDYAVTRPMRRVPKE